MVKRIPWDEWMYLGVDVGTSGVKAVLTDDGGAIVRQCDASLSVSRPRDLWSEQDPAGWWNAVEAAVLGLPARLRAGVRAIGLSGQMHGATLLAADDTPLRPAILWNDGRAFAECLELERREPRSREITGNIAMPGFTAPKLLWVARHEPEVFAATRTVLLPKEYVRLRMTGDKASDLSDSAGTLWLDCSSRGWSGAMLEATELPVSAMPRLYEGCEMTGSLRAEVAARWGMNRVGVAAGAGDNAAGAVGMGVIGDGDGLLSLGTSGVIFVATRDFRPNPADAVHAFCHGLPGLWHQMSVHLSAASCLDWAARLSGTSLAPMLAAAEERGAAAGPEIFLPYLSGERTPHNDPHVRGALLRLSNDTDPARLALAVLEGVAFAHADGLAALREAGTQIDALAVIGGGNRSRFWGRILASVLEVRLDYLDGGDVAPARGAARLAQLADTARPLAEICPRPATRFSLMPDASITGSLAGKRAAFRDAYPAIRNL